MKSTRRGAGQLVVSTVALLAGWRAEHGHDMYPDKPPLGHTGGFGEPTCLHCHLGHEPNAAGGALTLSGVPEVYRPGETYRVSVRIGRAQMVTGGFQLTARFADGTAAGHQAGELRAVDERTQVATDTATGVRYASHTKPGTEQTAQWAAEWALDWTAPSAAAGPVVFHLAANATNGDESPIGDFVYWKEAVARASAP